MLRTPATITNTHKGLESFVGILFLYAAGVPRHSGRYCQELYVITGSQITLQIHGTHSEALSRSPYENRIRIIAPHNAQ